MKHFLDHYQPSASPETSETGWIIFGKGPSFNKDVLQNYPDHKVMCINHTANYLNRVDVCIFNDHPVLEHLTSETMIKTKNFCCPASVIKIENSHDSVDAWANVGNKLQTYKEKFLFFDADFTPSIHRKFTDKPLIYANCSTLESALWLLGYAGFRKIVFNGIDYSTYYNPVFGMRVSKVPFTALKYYVAMITEFFGMEVTRV